MSVVGGREGGREGRREVVWMQTKFKSADVRKYPVPASSRDWDWKCI